MHLVAAHSHTLHSAPFFLWLPVLCLLNRSILRFLTNTFPIMLLLPTILVLLAFLPTLLPTQNHSSFFPSTDNFCFSSYCLFSLPSVFSPFFSPFYYFFTFIYLWRCASRGGSVSVNLVLDT